MQMFADHSFFAWLIVMTIPAFILGVFEKPIKYYGMFASLVFLWLALGHNTVALKQMQSPVLAVPAAEHCAAGDIQGAGTDGKSLAYFRISGNLLHDLQGCTDDHRDLRRNHQESQSL